MDGTLAAVVLLGRSRPHDQPLVRARVPVLSRLPPEPMHAQQSHYLGNVSDDLEVAVPAPVTNQVVILFKPIRRLPPG